MGKTKQGSKYSRIPYEARLKIVNYVDNFGLTIKRTSEILGLKASTTRMILKRYRDDGIIFERKEERHQRISDTNSKTEFKKNYFPENRNTDQSNTLFFPYNMDQCIPYLYMPHQMMTYLKYPTY
jgi:hypothetical protein